ncbi:hypothetical protein [Sorangium sp. So ce128]|uniref:hypothetical protein n=1 Tax=Sorangium sp. So ce128 TaxID=3133281 RepID=UPI003F5F887B
MNFLFEICLVVSVVLLGLLAGALWAEGALLVPYWKTLKAEEFYRLHPQYAPRLFRFFAPITAITPAAAFVAAVFAWLAASRAVWVSTVVAVLANSLVAIYSAISSTPTPPLRRQPSTPRTCRWSLSAGVIGTGCGLRFACWHSSEASLCSIFPERAVCWLVPRVSSTNRSRRAVR